MTKEFHKGIDQLRGHVLHMAAQARLNLDEGVRSLAAGDADLARRVLRREEDLNRLDVEVEAEALTLLALNQPMAADLRTIGASLKLITYLDRIGRYGYDIAKVALELAAQGGAAAAARPPAGSLLMAQKALAMLDRALEAYRDRDAAKARGVAAMDEAVDDLYDQAFGEAVAAMAAAGGDRAAVATQAHFLLVARHLERAGDNARKVAEKTLYMVTGERRLPLSPKSPP